MHQNIQETAFLFSVGDLDF